MSEAAMDGATLAARLAARRAVEALRNGVPNRDAVRELGCGQPEAERTFMEILGAGGSEASPGRTRGMLVSGDFGSGKSHLLAHLEDLALSRNFICSRVTISKETPLYDLGKVLVSAVENGRIPGRKGRLIEELALGMRTESGEYGEFFRRIDRASREKLLSPVFPASLLVYERVADFALKSDIEAFWAGDRILKRKIVDGLKVIGLASQYKFSAPKVAELPPQRLRFIGELIRSSGYDGWVVLLDEIELVGSYSILQRGRSYAELARWMGRAEEESYPGMVAVGAVTEDFAAAVIDRDGPKKDREKARPRLEASAKYAHLGDWAESGMDLLEGEGVTLDVPPQEYIDATMEKLRELYAKAYDWRPPHREETAGGAGATGRMRYKVRAAINEWDLRRLRPGYEPVTEADEFKPAYEEDSDMEHTADTD